MHIVMVSPEMAPVAKVGGLADVITGLSRELVEQGHTVEVMLPMYHCMRYDQILDLEEVYQELWVPDFNSWHPEQVFRGTVEGITCFFFTGADRFHRDHIYGYDDDMYRFVHFNRAVLEFMLKTERRPDVIHCHDWQTGLVPVIMDDMYTQWGFDKTRVVFTIHNIEHQGQCWYGEPLLGSIGLDCGKYFSFDRLQDNLKHNMVNLMKGGIVFSSFVTTVSPTYCWEIRTPEGGKGLDATLDLYADKLGGVLNGLDFKFWNPATDPYIARNYDADSFEVKYSNKFALRQKLGMPDEYRPLIACIARLVPQKGLHLIRHAMFYTLERGGQFVLLGSSPDHSINEEFERLRRDLSGNPNVYIDLRHNEELAHQIYAGADMFLVPSLFEPCGLTQLIALRYGAVPLVRNTGGLADTVFDVQYSERPENERNGYVFNNPDFGGVESVITRATEDWFLRGENFKELASNCMKCDYSWKRSAGDYINIYKHVIGIDD